MKKASLLERALKAPRPLGRPPQPLKPDELDLALAYVSKTVTAAQLAAAAGIPAGQVWQWCAQRVVKAYAAGLLVRK